MNAFIDVFIYMYYIFDIYRIRIPVRNRLKSKGLKSLFLFSKEEYEKDLTIGRNYCSFYIGKELKRILRAACGLNK